MTFKVGEYSVVQSVHIMPNAYKCVFLKVWQFCFSFYEFSKPNSTFLQLLLYYYNYKLLVFIPTF